MMLVAYPTLETLERVRQKLLSPPIHVEVDLIHIPIADNVQAWGGNETQLFMVSFTSVGIKYSTQHNYSRLVGEVSCDALTALAMSYGTVDQEHALQCIFMDRAPPLSSSVKPFIISLSDSFVRDQPFSFTLKLLNV